MFRTMSGLLVCIGLTATASVRLISQTGFRQSVSCVEMPGI